MAGRHGGQSSLCKDNTIQPNIGSQRIADPPHTNDGCPNTAIPISSYWVIVRSNVFSGRAQISTKTRGSSAIASEHGEKPNKPATRSQNSCSLFTKTIPNHTWHSR